MKKILAYTFATLLSLMLGIPIIVGFSAMVIYEPLTFLLVVGFFVIFLGGIWGFAYLSMPEQHMTYDQECGLTPYNEDSD